MAPQKYLSKFMEVMKKYGPKVPIHKKSLPKAFNIFELNLENFCLVSISAWFKVLAFVPEMRKYFTIPYLKKQMGRTIVTGMRQRVQNSDDCKIEANQKMDNLWSRLKVITWFLLDFILKDDLSTLSERNIMFMKIFLPAFAKTDHQSITAMLLALFEKNDSPMFPPSFVEALLESHFEMDSKHWPKYLLDEECYASLGIG